MFSPEVNQALSHIGHAELSHGFGTTFVRAIFAGFLIASMVWMMPGAGGQRALVVIVITWVVGIGTFSHVIAGSADTLYVVFAGQRSLGDYVFGFLVPAFLGNSIGGVAFVATLAHGQHAPD